MTVHDDIDELFVAQPGAVSCQLGGGLALLNLRSDTYYSLNGVGAFVWELVQEPQSFSHLHREVLLRYDVDEERSRSDLVGLLAQLSGAGLLRREDGPAR